MSEPILGGMSDDEVEKSPPIITCKDVERVVERWTPTFKVIDLWDGHTFPGPPTKPQSGHCTVAVGELDADKRERLEWVLQMLSRVDVDIHVVTFDG